jgi:hypothetical protein
VGVKIEHEDFLLGWPAIASLLLWPQMRDRLLGHRASIRSCWLGSVFAAHGLWRILRRTAPSEIGMVAHL